MAQAMALVKIYILLTKFMEAWGMNSISFVTFGNTGC